MKEKLLIIGASGHGKVVADIAMKMNKWQYIAFLDDDESIKSSMGIDVIGKSTDAIKYIKDYDLFIGLGNNDLREIIQVNLEAKGASIPILVHPSAIIGKHVNLYSGTVVMAGVVINCSSSIGKGCIINTSSTVDHDNFIEDYVHISPGSHLAGTVKVGRKSWLGIGSVIINNISIAKDVQIGAGAIVVKNLTEAGIYVGNPAKRLN